MGPGPKREVVNNWPTRPREYSWEGPGYGLMYGPDEEQKNQICSM